MLINQYNNRFCPLQSSIRDTEKQRKASFNENFRLKSEIPLSKDALQMSLFICESGL